LEHASIHVLLLSEEVANHPSDGSNPIQSGSKPAVRYKIN
jgi:hypothetical protein